METRLKIIIALTAILAFGIYTSVVWMSGNSHGKRICEANHAASAEQLRKKLNTMKVESDAKIQKMEAKLRTQRRKADAKISKLLSENAELKEWWDANAPDAAADFAYGLRE